MIDLKNEKSKTLAVTGHRSLPSDLNIERLEKGFYYFIDEKGYDTFLVGMAVGFDSLCFKILEKIRKKRKIKIIEEQIYHISYFLISLKSKKTLSSQKLLTTKSAAEY